MKQEAYEKEVAVRAEELISAGADQAPSLWSIHVHLSTGRVSDDEIVDVVARGVNGSTLGYVNPGTGGPFQILPAALLVQRWEDKLPEAAIEMIHGFFTRGMIERGNTENHWLMYYAGNLLAAERWPNEKTLWDGRPPHVIEAEATRWISGMIDRTAMVGHHEYDSPGYHVEHMTPLIGLFEHTRNEALRDKVEKVLTLMVADMALEYFYGSWAGGHSREGYRENTWTRVGPIRPLQYVYFGGEPFGPEYHLQQPYAYPSVVADYRPSHLFAEIALDRETPHVVRKTKAPRNIYRHTEEDAKPVRKYTYISRSFALGTSQIGLPSEAAGPIDLVSWDLHWRGEKHQAKVTCNHPFVSPSRFSAFLPGLPQTVGRGVGGGKPYLQRPDRLFGASPFERMVQHEGTVLIGYRIPETDACPFANLYLPKGINWIEHKEWLFGNLDDFYLAVRPIGDYAWEDIQESRHDSVMVSSGDLIDGWLLRIQDRFAGLALEAVEATEVASFEAFVESRSSRDVDDSAWVESGTLGIETHGGVRVCLNYDGDHTLDGEAIDYSAWPMYGSPNASAEVGTGQMTFRRGEDAVTVDFEIDREAELIPMRVIG